MLKLTHYPYIYFFGKLNTTKRFFKMLTEIDTLSVKTDEYLCCVMMSMVGQFSRLYDYNLVFLAVKLFAVRSS